MPTLQKLRASNDPGLVVGRVGAKGAVSWILLCLSSLLAVGTRNALWPLRRPWWLKLPSFNAGWFVNELPLHVLVGQAVVVVVLASLGALDGRPGQVGVVLSAISAVGLVVLAAAHRRARGAIDEALRHAVGLSDPLTREGGAVGPSLPRSWLLMPWLAWFRASGVERVAGVVYSTVAGRDLELDLYLPVGRPQGCPVLVEIHGGGWIAGDRRIEGRPLMAHMAARGWVCVSVDYRVGKSATWPDQIVDVTSALAWVREHVTNYGGDPDFVAVTGGSAGGHLAALAALAPDDFDDGPQSGTAATIRACVPFYGPYDFDNSLGLRPSGEMRIVERFVVKKPLAENATLYERGSPLSRVHRDAPPFLVVQGTTDNLVSPAESRVFVERMRSTSEAVVAYVEVPRAHHAFDVVPSVRTGHVIAGVDRFLTHVYTLHRQTAPSSTSGWGAGSGAT
jgi:acetyl esterase/lipase